MLWLFFGVGVPWALALLPRSAWPHRIEVLAVALLLGPALTTTVMFALGTLGHWTALSVLSGSGLLALIGIAFALHKANRNPAAETIPRTPLALVDWALITALLVVVLLHFWNTAYWPYDNYDEFWVYGYNAKIFAMQHAIPTSIGYYPQLVPLSLAYGQLLWGTLSEHAARTVVPYFELGSIAITYVLGQRLAGRRAGLVGAAIWALYSHHAGWAQYADLEVPLTFYFTGAAAYFIVAWRDVANRTAYALLGGVIAGAALWTKPTAGALIESAVLIAAVVLLWTLRRTLGSLRVRLMTALRAVFRSPLPMFGLALLPMGGMWYVRNVLYGHPPLVLPAGYWQDAAQRSGQELGWPLLLIGLLTVYLLGSGALTVVHKRQLLAGLALMLVVSIPSALDAHHLNVIEFLLIGGGGAIWALAARPWWQQLSAGRRLDIALLYAFIIPYFVTWFWSYSYHYRLSFAFVPLFAVQIGIVVERFATPRLALPVARYRMALVSAAVLLAAIPGWWASLSGLPVALNGTLPDDHAKQLAANSALITLVDYLNAHRPADRPLRVEASAELRLPFFFPSDDIRTTDYPTRLDQIADVDFFVDSSEGQQLYLYNGIFYNQVLSSLTRIEVMQRQITTDDHDFRFSVYTVTNAARFLPANPVGPIHAQIGDFAELVGYDLGTIANGRGERVPLTLYWRAIKAASIDYSVYIHLWNPQTQQLGGVWGGEPVAGAFSVWDNVPGTHFSDPYHTRLWQPGETIRDEWMLRIPKDTPPGVYQLRVGLFDSGTGQRLTVQLPGQPDSDGVLIHDFTVE